MTQSCTRVRAPLAPLVPNTRFIPAFVAEHGRRKTIIALDIVYALKRSGRTLYGACHPSQERMHGAAVHALWDFLAGFGG